MGKFNRMNCDESIIIIVDPFLFSDEPKLLSRLQPGSRGVTRAPITGGTWGAPILRGGTQGQKFRILNAFNDDVNIKMVGALEGHAPLVPRSIHLCARKLAEIVKPYILRIVCSNRPWVDCKTCLFFIVNTHSAFGEKMSSLCDYDGVRAQRQPFGYYCRPRS